MGAIPWWGYLLVWIISFSVYLTIYVFQINQAVIKNKDGYGYKINFNHPYEMVETEEGYDLIIHFVEK